MKINIIYDSYDNQTTGNEGLSNGRNVEYRNLFGHSVTIQGTLGENDFKPSKK